MLEVTISTDAAVHYVVAYWPYRGFMLPFPFVFSNLIFSHLIGESWLPCTRAEEQMQFAKEKHPLAFHSAR